MTEKLDIEFLVNKGNQINNRQLPNPAMQVYRFYEKRFWPLQLFKFPEDPATSAGVHPTFLTVSVTTLWSVDHWCREHLKNNCFLKKGF